MTRIRAAIAQAPTAHLSTIFALATKTNNLKPHLMADSRRTNQVHSLPALNKGKFSST